MNDEDLLKAQIFEGWNAVGWSTTTQAHRVITEPNENFYYIVAAIGRAAMIIKRTKGGVLNNLVVEKGNLAFGEGKVGEQVQMVLDAMHLSIDAWFHLFEGVVDVNDGILEFVRLRSKYRYQSSSMYGERYSDENLVLMKAYVKAFYEYISNLEYKRREGNHRRAANKSFKSFCSYIDKLTEKYARLVIVRVDLGFASVDADRAALDNNFSGTYFNPHMQDCRSRLFKALSSKKSPLHMVGYGCRLEYGLHKGFHFHAMFFLDGSRVQQHISAGIRIGEMWKEICGEYGRYWNCLPQPWHKVDGVGELNYYDVEKIESVKKVAAYLTKIDIWVKVCLPGCRRTFYKGVVKQIKAKRGRPRRKAISERSKSEEG